MNKELAELKQQISGLSDDELITMLTVNHSDYRQVAINLATEEVLRRRIALGLHVNNLFEEQYRKPLPKGCLVVVLLPIVLVLLPIVLSFLFVADDAVQYVLQSHPLDTLIRLFGIVPVAIVGGLLILPLGIILFAIREKHLMLYARVEILFGMIYGIYTVGDKNHWETFTNAGTSNIATWTALAASIYIVVRGLDNRNKALIEEKEFTKKEDEVRNREENTKYEIEDARHKKEMQKIKESLKQEGPAKADVTPPVVPATSSLQQSDWRR